MSKNYASKVIKVAESEVGYLEKRTNSQLGSKTANAGYNDWNKYARDLDTKYPNFLNGKKNGGNGYWWCDIFVQWCFIIAYGEAAAHKLLCHSEKSLAASCTASTNYFKQKGQWHNRTETPKVGDQIIFQSGGSPCHTGIVYKVDSNYVYTIEGNTTSGSGVIANGGCVAKKSYSRSSSYILGYGRPKYDKEDTTVTLTEDGAIYKYGYKDIIGGTSKILKNLKKGDKVTWIKDDGWGWSLVSYGSVTGWMMNRHLKMDRLSSFKSKTLSADKTAIVVDVKKKKEAGTKKLKKGTKYTLICTIESGTYKGKDYIKVGSERYYI